MKSSFFKIFDESFGIKVFAALIFFFLVISSSFISLFIHDRSRTMTEDMIKDGKLLAGILAHNSRIGVFSENAEMLDSPVSAIFQKTGVLEVSIFNIEGNLLKKREKIIKSPENGDGSSYNSSSSTNRKK